MRDPLVAPFLAVATGVILGRSLHFTIPQSLFPFLAFLLLALVGRTPRSAAGPPAGVFKLALSLALLFLGVLSESLHRPPSPPTIDATSRETLLATGCIVDPGREQFTLELEPDARAKVTPRDESIRLNYGQRVEIEARFRPPHNYNNPGSFDYASYLARRRIFWTASALSVRVLPGRCGSRFMAIVSRLRSAALDRIENLYPGDDYSTGMMEAILIGESSRLQKVWTENFRRTGTFHALVISGVHVTVLAGVLLFLLRLCALPEIPALTATATAAWLYAFVSGLSAPVVRAAGGFTLYLIARFFFRRGRVMNLLAAIALIYLLWDPEEMFEASFQLSFLCVAAIAALATPLIDATTGPIGRGLRSIANRDLDPHLEPGVAQFRVELRLAAETIRLWTHIPVLQPLAFALRLAIFAFEMAAISTVVQIGLALPMIEYFHRVSFSGLTANLLIVPLLNLVVPIGFAAIFTGWHWLAAAAGTLLRLAARIADWHASIEPAWRVPDPPLWLALSFIAALILTAIAQRWRIPAIATVLALFALLLWHPWPPDIQPHILELTAIDVGQGDSLLVVFPEGKRMLIDGGGLLQFGRKRRANLDTGEDVVSPYLWHRGIRGIDILVATHAHEDHSAGLLALIDNFRPREVWVGANPLPALIDRARRLGIPVVEKYAGETLAYSGVTIQILSPPPGYVAPKPGNNDSLALRIKFRERSFLLTGDLERPMEARLLASGLLAHSDVLKVGHHGSKTSTIQPFLDAVSPEIAIVSAGFENSFGHPHKDVLARLAARHSTLLRTDLDGLVTVRTDGTRLWFDQMSWQPPPPAAWTMAEGWLVSPL